MKLYPEKEIERPCSGKGGHDGEKDINFSQIK